MALLEAQKYNPIPENAVTYVLWQYKRPMLYMKLSHEVHKLARKYNFKGYSKRQGLQLAWDDLDYLRKYRNYIKSQPAAKKELQDLWELSLRKDVYIKCKCSGYPCRRNILIDLMHELFNDGTTARQQGPRPQDHEGTVVVVPENTKM